MTEDSTDPGERAIEELLRHAPHNARLAAVRHPVEGQRGEAVQALEAALEAWNALDTPEAVAMVHTLAAALHAVYQGDEEALEEPARWARARLGYDHKRSEGARAFVDAVEAWLERELGPKQQREHERLLREPMMAAQMADGAAGWLAIHGGHHGLVSEATAGSRQRMIAAVQEVARRSRPDARAYAVALLKGWGLSQQQADNRLKRADW